MKLTELISEEDRYPEFLVMKHNFKGVYPFFDPDKFNGTLDTKINKLKALINFAFNGYSLRQTAKSQDLPSHYFYNAIQRDTYFAECIEKLKNLRLQLAEDILFETIEKTENEILKIDIAKFVLERKGGWKKETRTDITSNGMSIGDIQIIEIQAPDNE